MSAPNVDLTGGCLCGAVRYAYAGPIGGDLGLVTLCHCHQCLKAQGGPVGAAPASARHFTVTAGEASIREFESSPGKLRAFCGACGSPLYSRRPALPDAIRLRIGSLDAPPESLRIEAHIFTADLAPWDDPHGAPSYPAEEPDRG